MLIVIQWISAYYFQSKSRFSLDNYTWVYTVIRNERGKWLTNEMISHAHDKITKHHLYTLQLDDSRNIAPSTMIILHFTHWYYLKYLSRFLNSCLSWATEFLSNPRHCIHWPHGMSGVALVHLYLSKFFLKWYSQSQLTQLIKIAYRLLQTNSVYVLLWFFALTMTLKLM